MKLLLAAALIVQVAALAGVRGGAAAGGMLAAGDAEDRRSHALAEAALKRFFHVLQPGEAAPRFSAAGAADGAFTRVAFPAYVHCAAPQS